MDDPIYPYNINVKRKKRTFIEFMRRKNPKYIPSKEQSDEDRNNLKEILDAVDNFFSQINKSPDRASIDLSLKKGKIKK